MNTVENVVENAAPVDVAVETPVVCDPVPMMYVSVHFRHKASSVHLKDKSVELTTAAGATADAAEARLRRLPKPVASLVQRPYHALYGYLKANHAALGSGVFAVPMYAYDKDGNRVDVWPGVQKVIDEAQQALELGIQKITSLAVSGELEQQVRAFAADLFNPDLLPSNESTVREWYGMDVDVDYKPSPAMEQLLTGMTDDARARINAQVEETRKNKAAAEVANLKAPLINGIRDLLDDMVERVSGDPKGVKFKSLCDRVDKVLVYLAPFNVDNDPRITETLAKIQDKFSDLRKAQEELRVSSDKRAKVAGDAKEIAEAFKAAFG